jgi:hypothetical protein
MADLTNALQIGTFVLAIGFAIRVFGRTKSYRKLVLASWAACILCALLNILVYPYILTFFGGAAMFSSGDEMQAWGLIGLFGFVLGFELAAIAWIFRLIKKGWRRLTKSGVEA